MTKPLSRSTPASASLQKSNNSIGAIADDSHLQNEEPNSLATMVPTRRNSTGTPSHRQLLTKTPPASPEFDFEVIELHTAYHFELNPSPERKAADPKKREAAPEGKKPGFELKISPPRSSHRRELSRPLNPLTKIISPREKTQSTRTPERTVKSDATNLQLAKLLGDSLRSPRHEKDSVAIEKRESRPSRHRPSIQKKRLTKTDHDISRMTFASKVHSEAAAAAKIIINIDSPGTASMQKRAFNLFYCAAGGSSTLDPENHLEVSEYTTRLTGLHNKNDRIENLEALYKQLKKILSTEQQAKFEKNFEKAKAQNKISVIRSTIKEQMDKID